MIGMDEGTLFNSSASGFQPGHKSQIETTFGEKLYKTAKSCQSMKRAIKTKRTSDPGNSQ